MTPSPCLLTDTMFGAVALFHRHDASRISDKELEVSVLSSISWTTHDTHSSSKKEGDWTNVCDNKIVDLLGGVPPPL